MRKNSFLRFAIGLIVITGLAGCARATELSAQPADLVQPVAGIPIQLAAENSKPSPTPDIFELRPTFTPIPTHTPFSLDNYSEDSYGPTNFPEGINPLTGLEVTVPGILERRPMLIKVTNFPRRVRPQWGLSLADHVYEYYLEDGMTRFAGVFYGQDADRVGPIRSGRPFDEQLVRMYKAIFVFGYADDRVVDPWMASDLKDFLVFQRPDNCPPMCRIGPETDYNTLYTDTHLLGSYVGVRGVEDNRQDLEGLRFRDYPLSGGGELNRVYIRYSRTSHHYWEYNPVRRNYLRSQETESNDRGEEVYEPLYDSLTARWLSADNLIILMLPGDYFFKSNSTEIFDYGFVGEGQAYALREGRVFDIRWKRATPESMISLTFPNGNNYPLKPGNVWFEVLSAMTTYEAEDGGIWRFYFDLPE